MKENAANRSLFWISIGILVLLSAGPVQALRDYSELHSSSKPSQVNTIGSTIGNQEALSSGHGSAINTINIREVERSSDLCAPSSRQGDVGWIVGDPVDDYGVILHTTNGGKDWIRQGSPSTIPNVRLQDVYAIDACNAWAVGGNDDQYGVILRTMDGGKSWIRCGSRESVPDFFAQGIGVIDRKSAWVVGSGGTIIHTKDGGRTWVQQASQTNAILYKVAVVNRNNAWIIGDQDGGYAIILRTSDGGRTWKRQGNTSSLNWALIDVTAADNKTAWVVGPGPGIAVSNTIDGGASWHTQMESDGPHMNGACAIDKNKVWLAQDFGYAYWTDDGGNSWNMQHADPVGAYLMSVSSRSLKTAWVVGAYQSGEVVGVILHTTNGGINWTEQSAQVNTRFWRISFVGTRST